MDEETRLVPAQFTGGLTNANTAALTPVAVEEVATKIVAALDLLATLIPDLRTPHPATVKKVRGARTVSREAIISIVAMVESSRVMQTPQLVNTERAREILEHDYNFRILDERMERLRAQVRYTIEARWAELVQESMDAYHMAKVYVKDPRNADLAPHIATIRDHLDRTNGKTARKKKKDEGRKDEG